MKTPYQLLSIILLLSFALSACVPLIREEPGGKLPASASVEMIMYIAEYTQPCTGVAETECLLVRFDLAKDFELFYDVIDGFTYEPGFAYELRVIRTEVLNPPADASKYRWVLLEETAKSPVMGLEDAPMILPAIVGNEWAWVRTENGSEIVEVNGPERYTLQLMEDGTYTARLDCNTLSGLYTMVDGRLKMEPGPMTLRACQEDSQADEYLNQLNAAEVVTLTDTGVTIMLSSGATMFFALNDVGYVEAEMTTPELSELSGRVWQWAGTTTGEDVIEVVPSIQYTLEFLEDGTFAAQVDCNVLAGTYTLDSAALTMTPGPSTLAACPEGSKADEYLRELSAAAIVFMLDGDLYIDMIYDSGTMHFVAP